MKFFFLDGRKAVDLVPAQNESEILINYFFFLLTDYD